MSDDEVMTYSNFKAKYCFPVSFLEFYGVASAIRSAFWQSVKEFFVSIHLIPASHVSDIYECLGVGGEDDDVLLNHCLLLARYYIYCCKFKNVSPCIGEYVQRLKFNFEIEKQVSMVTGSEIKFRQRWCKILQAL